MLIGRAVFVYRNDAPFSKGTPGIVTGVYPEREGFVFVEAFFPADHHNSHAVAMSNVALVNSGKEAREQFAAGMRYVCAPYDPANPAVLTDAPELPAVAPLKSKK